MSSGTLTLKAGSKVYVPNGNGVFDTVTTTQDLSMTITNNGRHLIYKNPGNYINYQAITTSVSGTTDSLSGTPWHLWYDTTNNVINRYGANGTTAMPGQSLPIAVVTVSGGAISSIDQVFNGFGYIGSTVFALPGIKALAPNGRNSDGTLKNELRTTNVVSTVTASTNSADVYIAISAAGSIAFSVPASRLQYKESENKWYDSQNGYAVYAMGARVKIASTKITELLVPTVFHAVDYNDYQKTAEQTNTNTTNIATLGTSKANTSLDNVSAGIDFVVESQEPTAENDYTWYRKYRSGSVEQGGISIAMGDYETATITLPVAMANINYTLTFGNGWNGTNDDNAWIGAYCERLPNRTTTSFQLYNRGGTQRKISFVVSGKAA